MGWYHASDVGFPQHLHLYKHCIYCRHSIRHIWVWWNRKYSYTIILQSYCVESFPQKYDSKKCVHFGTTAGVIRAKHFVTCRLSIVKLKWEHKIYFAVFTNYNVPEVIWNSRQNIKMQRENEILYGIFRVVSRFRATFHVISRSATLSCSQNSPVYYVQ